VRQSFALATLVVLVTIAGCFGGATPTPGVGDETGTVADDGDTASLRLAEQWTAGNSSVEGNHHAIAAGRVDGEGVVAVPIGGRSGEAGCRLLVLDGDGNERWTEPIPTDACTIHAVADPTLADFVGDDRPELVAASTERVAVAYDPLTGEERFSYPLSDYGYSQPVVADATGDRRRNLVVTDVDGTLSVAQRNGSTAWRRPLNAYSWAAPAVADFDADGRPETVVGLGNETAVAFDAQGEVAWTTTVPGSVTWTADGDTDGDAAREFLAATPAGVVASIDGRNGTVEWTASLGAYAAVGEAFDSNDDGTVEVYATNQTGTLFALDGRTGRVEWSRKLTDGDTQMTPPPVAGDVTGDGTRELVAVTNDGLVRVVDPADGTVLATYRRDAAVYTHATLADTDGDGRQELYVLYGDGTAVALAVQRSSSAPS
jgi:outer membrane protein assembly factor BamB